MLVTLQSDITVCHSGLMIYQCHSGLARNLSKKMSLINIDMTDLSFYERP